MSKVNLPGDKLQSVITDAHHILDAYGGLETSDSPRVMYTEGDLNIAREGGVLEIIFRGTLVLRYSLNDDSESHAFIEGDWLDEVERIAKGSPQSPAPDEVA